MRARVGRFASFWWTFLVGDDWRLAAGAFLAIGSTMLLRSVGLPVWWLEPGAVALLLTQSMRRATRKR